MKFKKGTTDGFIEELENKIEELNGCLQDAMSMLFTAEVNIPFEFIEKVRAALKEEK